MFRKTMNSVSPRLIFLFFLASTHASIRHGDPSHLDSFPHPKWTPRFQDLSKDSKISLPVNKKDTPFPSSRSFKAKLVKVLSRFPELEFLLQMELCWMWKKRLYSLWSGLYIKSLWILSFIRYQWKKIQNFTKQSCSGPEAEPEFESELDFECPWQCFECDEQGSCIICQNGYRMSASGVCVKSRKGKNQNRMNKRRFESRLQLGWSVKTRALGVFRDRLLFTHLFDDDCFLFCSPLLLYIPSAMFLQKQNAENV